MASDPDEIAHQAAEVAGVALRDAPELTATDRTALARLFNRVWGRDVATQGSIISGEILWATSHAGAQVTAAYAGDELVGGTATFLGRDDDGPLLHSHLTGVRPQEAGRGIGWALKQHQRAWALRRDVDRVVWTYDPLVRRNAVFNLVRLGVRPVAFLEDLYGPMSDARNAGLPTDRLLVQWDLQDPRVVRAASGRHAEPRIEGLRRAGAVVVLDVGEDDQPVATPSDAPRQLARIPADIEALRARDPDRAAAWSTALRQTLGRGVTEGMRITGITRDGWYVLARAGGVTEMA